MASPDDTIEPVCKRLSVPLGESSSVELGDELSEVGPSSLDRAAFSVKGVKEGPSLLFRLCCCGLKGGLVGWVKCHRRFCVNPGSEITPVFGGDVIDQRLPVDLVVVGYAHDGFAVGGTDLLHPIRRWTTAGYHPLSPRLAFLCYRLDHREARCERLERVQFGPHFGLFAFHGAGC